jgi:hypothetical protein
MDIMIESCPNLTKDQGVVWGLKGFPQTGVLIIIFGFGRRTISKHAKVMLKLNGELMEKIIYDTWDVVKS